MKMDVLMPRQPTVAFGLMGVEVVENHVDLAARVLGLNSSRRRGPSGRWPCSSLKQSKGRYLRGTPAPPVRGPIGPILHP
jgi:hypothetical protein